MTSGSSTPMAYVQGDPLGALAAVLLPRGADSPGVLIEADPNWKPPPSLDPRALGVERIAWGRPPLRPHMRVGEALRRASARERAILVTARRARSPSRTVDVHRLHPSVRGSHPVTAPLRRWLRAGALIEVATARARARPLDEVAADAGLVGPIQGIEQGSGGTLHALVDLPQGTPAVLRLAPAGAAGDPCHHDAALRHLEGRGLPMVPRPIGAGVTAGLSWTLESRLPGKRPLRLTSRVALEVSAFASGLPVVDQPADATLADLDRLILALPSRGPALAALLEELRDPLSAQPGRLRHGDMWSGNLLVRHGRLSGIVDWDAIHPAGLAGTDLLQLVATERRHRNRRALGSEWLLRPWRTDAYRSVTEAYWRRVGPAPPEEVLSASWWAAEASGTLRRAPQRAQDEQWLATNVDAVLAALGHPPEGT